MNKGSEPTASLYRLRLERPSVQIFIGGGKLSSRLFCLSNFCVSARSHIHARPKTLHQQTERGLPTVSAEQSSRLSHRHEEDEPETLNPPPLHSTPLSFTSPLELQQADKMIQNPVIGNSAVNSLKSTPTGDQRKKTKNQQHTALSYQACHCV